MDPSQVSSGSLVFMKNKAGVEARALCQSSVDQHNYSLEKQFYPNALCFYMQHASIMIAPPSWGIFSLHSGGPIFPYPDLPPEEVVTPPLPRHFNISSPDGTSPSQSPCPCLACRCRHAWVAQDLWERPHNLWESPRSPLESPQSPLESPKRL